MPRFSYLAIDQGGKELGGNHTAMTVEEAIAELKGRGLFPTEISEDHSGTGAAALLGKTVAVVPGLLLKDGAAFTRRLPFLRPVKPRELMLFTRQLATLLRAGMPLLRGLQTLARHESNATFRGIIEALAAHIRSGGTLSDGLAQHPRVFDRLYRSMIKAGEAGGLLDAVLDRQARFLEKSLQLRGKVKAAMVYPCVVLSVAIAILAGLLVFVVPQFKKIFADLLKGAPLSSLTQGVLNASDFVRAHYIVVIVGLMAAWFAFGLFRRSPRGGKIFDGLLVRMPIFGDLILKSLVARFSRTLGTLLSSGVAILPSLLITRDTCGNARVADAIGFVHDRVKAGEPVARSLESTQVLPPMVTSMIDVGEHTGQLPAMLGKIADLYDDEVDNAVAGLSSLIEPVLILMLAGIVGTIVIALFLPIVRIVQLLT
jgi:type IV pilus assembly protein PilC